MKNPFVFEKFVTGESFCGRGGEMKAITQLVADNKNILLYSRRRFGKSSLITELFKSKLNKKQFLPVYVDLYDILTAKDFARLFYEGVSQALPYSTDKAFMVLKNYFRHVTFKASLSFGEKIGFNAVLQEVSFEELVADSFNGLEAFAKDHNITAVVAFDEFQQIAEIKHKKIDALIRKYIQKQEHTSYIFSGSKMHMLTNIFNSHRAPLFGMATSMEITELSIKTFYKFCNKKLSGRLPFDVFEFLFQITGGESKLVQQACYHLFYLTAKQFKLNHVDEVIVRILNESDSEFRRMLDRFSHAQRIALKTISKNKGKNLFSQKNLRHFSITKATLNSAIRALIKDEFVDKDHEQYYIEDRKFELWCERIYR